MSLRGRRGGLQLLKGDSLKTPGGFGFPGFFFSLLEFELDNDGVIGRAETIGKGFCKARSGSDSLFDRGIHG